VVAVHTKPLSVQSGRVMKGSFYDTLNISPEKEMETTMRRWNVRRTFRPETTRHVPVAVEYPSARSSTPSTTTTTTTTNPTTTKHHPLSTPSHTVLPSFLQANLNREAIQLKRAQARFAGGASENHSGQERCALQHLRNFYYKLGCGFHGRIVNNRFEMIRDLGSFQSRNINTVQMILGTLQQYHIPDTEFLVCTDDKTRTPDWVDAAGVPILVMAKKRAQTYFTYPDHTFWDWQEAKTRGWEAERAQIQREANTTFAEPFHKTPVAFFRGNLETSYLRKVFAQASANERESSQNQKQQLPPPTLDVQDVHVGRSDTTHNTTHNPPTSSSFVPLKHHAMYKYLLHIPGRSYAARLKYLLATNSTVVYIQKKPEHEYREFWYDGLVDGKTCLFVRDANRYDAADSPRPDTEGKYRDQETVSQVQSLVRQGLTAKVTAQQELVRQLQWKAYWACLLVNVGRVGGLK